MQIEVSVIIDQDIQVVWELWTNPVHIMNWNFAHESWCCPSATNNLVLGGEFSYRMEARDHSMGFDFAGKYLEVSLFEKIVYSLGDRYVTVIFTTDGTQTVIKETFDADESHSTEQQQNGWMAILNNFKSYAEKFEI